jgi:16S rRNA (cytidine1402-2'-O)-methyltransferase
MSSIVKGLYIVSTPIGNLDDISLRAIKVLKASDIILCEDTRHSYNMLKHFNISKKLISYHKFNEKKALTQIIKHLKDGKTLSLISDAGTPTISDPGNILINECIKEKISVIPIPGPSSITSSMSISGFDQKFLFYGFLPKKEGELNKILSSLTGLNFSMIFFIPSLKVNFYITAFKKYFKGRKIMLARELTKKHETIYRDLVEEVKVFKLNLKGELTVVISEKINKDIYIDLEKIKIMIKKYLLKYRVKDVVELISDREKMPKREIYKLCLELKKNEKSN